MERKKPLVFFNLELGDKVATSLLTEYKKWSTNNDDRFRLLDANNSEINGRFCMILRIDEDEEFILHCPLDYPHSTDKFNVEAKLSLRDWCQALNKAIQDSTRNLHLGEVLTKAKVLYDLDQDSVQTAHSESLRSESEGDDDDDGNDDNAVYLGVKGGECSKSKEENGASCSSTHPGPIDGHLTQASSISDKSLRSEIKNIQSSKHLGIDVEMVDGNIDQWSVFLTGFDLYNNLHEDLQWLGAHVGYNCIQLHVEFLPNCNPLYPPIVRLVRPRLEGISPVELMMLVNYDIWNPRKGIKDMFLDIKNVLGCRARVDRSCEANDSNLHPEGVWMDVEDYLLRLMWATDFPFQVYHTIFGGVVNSAETTNEDQNVSQRRVRGGSLGKAIVCMRNLIFRRSLCKNNQANSTDEENWSTKSLSSIEIMKDREIGCLLQRIMCEIENVNVNNNSHDLGTHPFSNGPFDRNILIDETSDANDATILTENKLFLALKESTLPKFISFHIASATLNNVLHNKGTYQSVIELLNSLKVKGKLSIAFKGLPDQGQSILFAVKKIEKEVRKILAMCSVSSNYEPVENYPLSMIETYRNVTRDDTQWALMFHESCVDFIMNNRGWWYVGKSTPQYDDGTIIQGKTKKRSPESSLQIKYTVSLKPFQVSKYKAQEYFKRTSYLEAMSVDQHLPTPELRARVLREVSSLRILLPLNLENAIFMCFDEEYCMYLRFLIIGPKGTPYSNGCFIFDVMIPPSYPNVPPMVVFCQPKNEEVTFSPRISQNDQVLLPLLSASTGDGEGTWKVTSTLFEVLDAILTEVMVPQPYFTHPSEVRVRGTDTDEQLNQVYNRKVQLNTIIHGMIEMIRNPDQCFDEVILTHFQIKKQQILQEVNEFLELNPSMELANTITRLQVFLDNMNLKPTPGAA